MDLPERTVVLAGNSNVGKSTVFNALTGLRQHTGNWPGKTVENARGSYVHQGIKHVVTDVPGAYSLNACSPEEAEAVMRICAEQADVIVVVCDACALKRSLCLALQIAELNAQVVVCINLLDEAKRRGVSIDLALLERRLGLPVVGTSARSGVGLEALRDAISASKSGLAPVRRIRYPDAIERAISALIPCLSGGDACVLPRFAALRLLSAREETLIPPADSRTIGVLRAQKQLLAVAGYDGDALQQAIIESAFTSAADILDDAWEKRPTRADKAQQTADRVLTSRLWGVPVMLVLLLLIFYLTLTGANVISDLLAAPLSRFGTSLLRLFQALSLPPLFIDLAVNGVYKTLSCVVSVMLPPMAIFFPLFTLLEDLGYLPRIAFNLDHPLKKCGGCGRQALTMCMGLGCNAVGVTGCRIIESPRERLIAQLTNAFIPCNGRLPTLVMLISLFPARFLADVYGAPLGALLLTLFVLFGIGVTFAASKLLSLTLLGGIPSSFALELPPYRKPQIGKTILRSMLDRTLFVLGRAALVAAPAGMVIWLLANLHSGETTPLALIVRLLAPLGRLMGMDGETLCAFLLGLPANEIVLPLAAMTYAKAGAMTDVIDLAAFGALLSANGWTTRTAICAMLFSVCHWPCSTTILTLKKETGSLKWTIVGVLLPTICGVLLCMLTNAVWSLFS